jgi:hypothetical protein
MHRKKFFYLYVYLEYNIEEKCVSKRRVIGFERA